jgi:CheY-like chemotaxis protein
VDDIQVNRLIAREMMMSCGAEVSEVESGEQALAAVHEARDSGRPYRIILLDMRMPGMDGLEVARRIRQDHLPVEPLILMLSSDDLNPQIERMREIALDAYLVKPITRKQLFEAVYRALAESNRQSAKPMPQQQVSSVANGAAGSCENYGCWRRMTHRTIACLISAFLRREPYEIDFAENGEVAVARFRAALAAGCDVHLAKPIKKLNLLEAMRNATALLRVHTAIAAVAEINGEAMVAPAKP